LIVIKGESCVIDLLYGPTTFRSTFIKPYYTSDIKEATNNKEEEELEKEAQKEEEDKYPSLQILIKASKHWDRPSGNKNKLKQLFDLIVYLQSDISLFKELRQKKVVRLIKKGIFKIINANIISGNVQIFKLRFINKIKNKGTKKAFKKSRLII